MSIGKELWLIILIKLFIIFVVIRIFFFRNFLNTKFNSQEDKTNYVIKELTKEVK